MIHNIIELLKRFFRSRLAVVGTAMVLLFGILLGRVYFLQIVHGDEYQNNFEMLIEKTLSVYATRGNIYDVNGNLLAYNELAYSIVISDSGEYDNSTKKHAFMNAQLAEITSVLEKNGDKLYNNFKISFDPETESFSFNVSGTQLRRFLADVYGKSSYSDLGYNKKLGYDTSVATADQVMEYLITQKFKVSEEYSLKTAYEIVVIRYAMQSVYYSRYKTISIAENVSEKTLAYINEHSSEFIGVSVREDTIRKYNDSTYFASILGYTGKISQTEYENLSQNDSSYTTTDTVGKSGLEQYYESFLRGKNGEQVVYVDTLGRITEIVSNRVPVAGNDLYISIDAELQKSVYQLLEQEIAGIVYSNIKSGNIPIIKVYFALIDNNVIDINHFTKDDATDTEKAILNAFLNHQAKALDMLKEQLYSSEPLSNNEMSEELLDYFTYAISLLKNESLLLSSKIDTSDSVYNAWKNGTISPQEYLMHCITQQWIDISLLNVEDKYTDTAELYNAVCDFLFEEAAKDKDFSKYVYKYMLEQNEITGQQLCLVLMEQGVVDYDSETYDKIVDGSLTAYKYLLQKIDYIEITPAQLALDPCTGSCVITDVNTGEIRALVSYPGYDNNKLANGVDAEYYAKLIDDNSNPLWNYATQEKTAPGSTFKMLSSVAGLAEMVLEPHTLIECTGKFLLVDNEPACWIHQSGGRHGYEKVSTALRDSCNMFYYMTGYMLSSKDTGVYNDQNGISYIQKYASIFGLDKKTGLEITESTSQVANEYPVMAAIGQSNNSYTTVALSRYVSALSNGKLYDYQLMNQIVDPTGKVIAKYQPEYEDVSYVLNDDQWSSIRTGMNLMCKSYPQVFGDLSVEVAGKTGTAQQIKTRPNHALFLCYAPYENPEISIATRIAYGYAAANARDATKNILAYYYGDNTLEEILSLHASGVNSSLSNIITD